MQMIAFQQEVNNAILNTFRDKIHTKDHFQTTWHHMYMYMCILYFNHVLRYYYTGYCEFSQKMCF